MSELGVLKSADCLTVRSMRDFLRPLLQRTVYITGKASEALFLWGQAR